MQGQANPGDGASPVESSSAPFRFPKMAPIHPTNVGFDLTELVCYQGVVQINQSPELRTRRDFLRRSTFLEAALAAPALLPGNLLAGTNNDTLRVGLIGCGGRGSRIMKTLDDIGYAGPLITERGGSPEDLSRVHDKILAS